MYYFYEHLCPTKTEKRECVCGLVLVRGGRGKNSPETRNSSMSERVDTRKTHLLRCYGFSASGPKYHYCKCQRCEWNQPQRDGFEWLVKETRKFLQEQACPSWPPILPVSFVALPLCPSSLLFILCLNCTRSLTSPGLSFVAGRRPPCRSDNRYILRLSCGKMLVRHSPVTRHCHTGWGN